MLGFAPLTTNLRLLAMTGGRPLPQEALPQPFISNWIPDVSGMTTAHQEPRGSRAGSSGKRRRRINRRSVSLDRCIASLYNRAVIKTFQHKGLETFFRTGSKVGIQPVHAKRLRLELAKLDAAKSARDMDLPGWRLHRLKGGLTDHWAVGVDKNWRMTFIFQNEHAVLVDYQDYH